MIIEEINKSNSKQKVKDFNEDMIKPPFFMIISAPRKAGKSNLILNMLTRADMYKNIWNNKDIFVFSPSLDINDDFADVKANKIAKFDNDIITQIMAKQKELITKHGQSKVKPLLLIFDDCLSEKKFGTMNSCIEQLAIRGRHLLISVILTTQSMRRISRTCRLNTDAFIVMRFKNETEYDAFVEEFISKRNRKAAIASMKKIFETPYTFVVVDLATNDEGRRYRINFSDPVNLGEAQHPN